MTANTLGSRLEHYSQRHPQEVLLVTVTWREAKGEPVIAEVMVYKGFSSSLTGATAYDPDIPTIPEQAELVVASRLKGPYNPAQPEYLQQNLTWPELEAVLQAAGC
jgi:hypothetical protein